MAEEIDASHISVVPDQAMLADPATEYPVYVDPSWSGGLQDNIWKMVANRSDLVNSSTFTLNNGAIKGDAGAGHHLLLHPGRSSICWEVGEVC